MRSLSSTLLAAQRSASAVPYVQVQISDRMGGVTRLVWSRLYSGSEDDCYHAATMPGDGSLNRARVDPSAYQLFLQRVVNPGPGSDFANWMATVSVSSVSGIAMASRGTTVLLFYVATDQKTIYVRESTNYGATWGSEVTVTTAASSVGWLAADINPSSVACLFYSVGGTLYAVKRTGGTWGSPASWSNGMSNIVGVGCVYQGDWNVVVAGQTAGGGQTVSTCVYGDGYSQSVGTWSALAELTSASSGSSVELRCPCLGRPDTFRAFFVERYTGTISYSRPYWAYYMPSTDFINNLWREPVPFNLNSTYGMALAYSSAYAWLSTPSGVWRATLNPSSVDVSADVLGLTCEDSSGSGSLRIELRNDDGRYLTLGSGTYAPIRKGSEVWVSPGYRTSAGNQVSTGPAYWIEGWEYTSGPADARFVIHARDGWRLLEKWRARRQYAWSTNSKNVFQLLSFVLARAGLELSGLSLSSPVTNHYPAFTISPQESGRAAAERLLAMVPDVLFFRGGHGYLKYPQAADASDYSYGTNHAILQGNYATAPQPTNRVQVYGSGAVAESFSWGEIDLVYDRLQQVHDLNLNTGAKAQNRADAELRRAEMEATLGEITVPANCGQELYDVIDITDSRAGLSAAKRRVTGLALRYSKAGNEPRYQQHIALGGV